MRPRYRHSTPIGRLAAAAAGIGTPKPAHRTFDSRDVTTYRDDHLTRHIAALELQVENPREGDPHREAYRRGLADARAELARRLQHERA